MTFAWYAHLKDLRDKIARSNFGQRSGSDAGPSRVSGEGEPQGWGEHKPWIIAALVSWGIALIEYLFQVPANRMGYGQFDLGQLKIMQEIIALAVFVPFAFLYMKEPLRMDFVWAGLCLVGAAYFMFRQPLTGGA